MNLPMNLPVELFVMSIPAIPLFIFTYYVMYQGCQCFRKYCYNKCCLECVPYPKVGIIRLKNEPSNMYIQYELLHITAPFTNYHLIDTRLLTHSQIYSRIHRAFETKRYCIILLGTFARLNDYGIWKQVSLQNDYSYFVKTIDGNDGR